MPLLICRRRKATAFSCQKAKLQSAPKKQPRNVKLIRVLFVCCLFSFVCVLGDKSCVLLCYTARPQPRVDISQQEYPLVQCPLVHSRYRASPQGTIPCPQNPVLFALLPVHSQETDMKTLLCYQDLGLTTTTPLPPPLVATHLVRHDVCLSSKALSSGGGTNHIFQQFNFINSYPPFPKHS